MLLQLRDIMGEPPVTARPDDDTQEALRRMRKRGVHALPVVDDEGKPIGVITLEDLADADGTTPIGDLMTSPPLTVEVYLTIRDAARIMRDERVHHVVVTHRDVAVGVLSALDLAALVCTHRLVPDDQWKAMRQGASGD